MGDPKVGLIDKFRVERTDGTSAPGKKHDGCAYFVLDLTHDAFALPALKAYAEACAETFPLLAADLRNAADKQDRFIQQLNPPRGTGGA